MNTQPQTQAEVLRPAQAAAYCGISRRQLYHLAEVDPEFPRKIVFSARCVGWRRSSLDAWLHDKEASA